MPADRDKLPTQMLTPEQLAARRPVMMFILIAAIAPLALTGIATIVQIFLVRDLPGRVAVHWNAAGQPDNWAPAWSIPVMTAVIGLALVALLAFPAIAALNGGDRGPTYRFLGAVTLATVTLTTVLFTGTAWLQTDGGEVAIFGLLGVALALAAAAGVLGWFAQPAQVAPQRDTAAAPLPLADGEQAAWLATVTAGRPLLAIMGGSILLTTLAALFTWAGGTSLSVVITLAVLTLVVLVLAMVTGAYRVRVAGDGLTVTSVTGLPCFHIPLGEIADVRVQDEVNPLGEYGGYGIRMKTGTTAVIVRRGPAIIVERTSGRRFAVVVDDAATGAALLASYAGTLAAD